MTDLMTKTLLDGRQVVISAESRTSDYVARIADQVVARGHITGNLPTVVNGMTVVATIGKLALTAAERDALRAATNAHFPAPVVEPTARELLDIRIDRIERAIERDHIATEGAHVSQLRIERDALIAEYRALARED